MPQGRFASLPVRIVPEAALTGIQSVGRIQDPFRKRVRADAESFDPSEPYPGHLVIAGVAGIVDPVGEQ